MTTGVEDLAVREPAVTGTPHARARRWSPSLVSGAVLVGLVAVVGLVALVWTPYPLDVTGSGPRLAPPGGDFPAGTDRLGRDLLTQLMAGAASALLVAAASVVVAGTLGLVLGVLAAATTRWADTVLVNMVDVLIAFPTLLLAMLLVTVRGASTATAIAAIGISGAAVIARVTRITVARVLREDYVTAATASGTGWWGTITRHVLPNVAPTLLVQLMLLAGGAVLAESALSYLGLGTPPPAASWGRMLREAQSTMVVAPWSAILPGLAIVVLVLGLNLLGDGIRERTDPNLRGDR
ncbi:ABC transporter permease [Cellulomonas sp.]|uniref:ABC transporter permease n=1 Tax=Cellulomonas sp. TaxID=40001 RepID=UPI002811B6E1|nr:ABC transporter permease [Cellulomonas sp.]